MSDFESGDEGLTVAGDFQGDSADPNYSVDGDNLGGHIFAVDGILLERPATLRHHPSSMLNRTLPFRRSLEIYS